MLLELVGLLKSPMFPDISVLLKLISKSELAVLASLNVLDDANGLVEVNGQENSNSD